MANIIENLFGYIDILSNVIPLVLFAVFYKEVGNINGLRIIVVYSISNIIINVIILSVSSKSAQLVLYEVQTLVEYILFTWFILSQLSRRRPKQWLLISSSVYVLFFFLFNLFLKKEDGFDSIPIGIEAILILGFAFYYLYERMNDTTTLFIYNTYQFWVVLGIVLYLAGTFFIYVFTDYLRSTNNYATVDRIWPVTNIFSIIKSLLFAIAVLVHAKPSKETTRYHLEVSSLN